ncbi:MAG: DUF3501 family protein [Acidimicrobiia bacterium]
MMQKLTIDDIKDMREYERERQEFRARIIALKKRRRVTVGDFVTLVFENTETMRFQVQEMARVERILTDEGIQHELDTYNELIPDPGELSATMLIELTTDDQLRDWLPKLVGIQRYVRLDLGDGTRISAWEPGEERLTREEGEDAITSSVHYVKFDLTREQAVVLRDQPARLEIDHPDYQAITELRDETRAELASDVLDH